ncbi:YihY/virulence factor BrkB family protein [Lacipirellula sp.]|uniref:YihY/virulence factor BrkB family protein n=1 Tax=Lacipirellula sp. TaxID=2691419 RepID=UPI003D09E937
MIANLRNFFVRIWNAYHHFADRGGTMMAAAVAYYLAFSLFPLLLVLVAGLGWAFRTTAVGHDAQQRVLAAIAEQASPTLRDQIQEAFNAVEQKAGASGSVGLIVLLIASVAIFTELDYAFDRLWDRPNAGEQGIRKAITNLVFVRLKALIMLIGVGAFVIAVMIVSIVWQGVESIVQSTVEVPAWVRQLSQPVIHIALNFLAFTALYTFVPKTHVRAKAAFAGGALAALLWEVGRQVLAMYVLRKNLPTAYGVIGSFMAIMLWTYYAMIVILFGAAYAKLVNDEQAAAKLDRPE